MLERNSPSGISGEANDSQSYGVRGINQSGPGVSGLSTSGAGVRGFSSFGFSVSGFTTSGRGGVIGGSNDGH